MQPADLASVMNENEVVFELALVRAAWEGGHSVSMDITCLALLISH
jgi:hypothetical protein